MDLARGGATGVLIYIYLPAEYLLSGRAGRMKVGRCPENERQLRFIHIYPPGVGRRGGFWPHFYHLFVVLPIQFFIFYP